MTSRGHLDAVLAELERYPGRCEPEQALQRRNGRGQTLGRLALTAPRQTALAAAQAVVAGS